MLVAGIVSGVANSGSYDITQIDGTNGLTSHKRFGIGLYSDRVRGFFFFSLLQDLSCSFSSWTIQSLLVPIAVLSLIEFFFSFNFIVCSFVFVCYCCLSCDHFWYCSLPTWHRTWILPDPMAVENLDENLDDKVCILYKVTIFYPLTELIAFDRLAKRL
jgi:hypothetical protein